VSPDVVQINSGQLAARATRCRFFGFCVCLLGFAACSSDVLAPSDSGGTHLTGNATAAGAGAPGLLAAVGGSGGGTAAAAGRPDMPLAGAAAAAGSPRSAAGNGGVVAGIGGPAAGAGGAAAGAGGSAGAAGRAAAGAGGTGAMASAGSSAAGSGATDSADCGQGGMLGKASNAGAAQGRGYGSVEFTVSAGNQITRMLTTMEVPVKPTGNSTLFLWPGLEPLQGDNFNPIGTGVLQPVLTWGGSCAPHSPQTSPGNWWISAQYVNTFGSDPKHMGCYGGPVMNVAIGDLLLIDMSLKDTIWSQTVTDQMSNKSVAFDIDMEKQPQRWALFEIETPTSTRPAADVVFTNTVLTFAKPEPKACQPSSRGTSDYFSTPTASSDGLRCCVARLVLRAQGVAATTKDP
jgi:hypothetical protein